MERKEKWITSLRSYGQIVDDRVIDVLFGIRTILILLVGWFHIWQQSWLTPYWMWRGKAQSLDFLLRSGYIWVDGLILLSAFLLYLPAARTEAMPATLPFFKKRFFRIFPSYALNVVIFFLAALPKYGGNTAYMLKDLVTHLTFTHTFFADTYYGSPINGALWTVGIEVQFYLLFPLIGRAYKKLPLLMAGTMMVTAYLWRSYAHTLPDCAMWFNQLPAFLDVYALGFLGADAFVALRKKMSGETRQEKWLFTFVCVLCLGMMSFLAHQQAAQNSTEAIRLSQMDIRFMLTLSLLIFMISACFSVWGVRFFLGNRVMKFLSEISFQFYMYHQVLAVLMKKYKWISSPFEQPNMAGDFSWQLRYTILCFLVPLLLAAVLTYFYEKPIINLVNRTSRGRKTGPR